MNLVYPNEKRLFQIAAVLAGLFWLAIIVGTLGVALLYVGIFFLFGIFAQAGFITYMKGNGVLVSAEQFPDIHAQLLACCEKVGVDEVPDTYLLRTDFFNALATRFLRRHYIVLFTDVVDALQDEPDALNFYLGHELGHIHRKHIRWGWFLAPALLLPVLGFAYRRAEEYTCDRYGNACCTTDDGAVAALAAIVAGDTRWKQLNVPAYLQQADTTGGFWMSLNEFLGDYPWMCKRVAWVMALRNGTEPEFPRRNGLAGFLSLFVPSIPGGFLALMITVAFLGILAAVALPAYQDYVTKAQQAAAASDSTGITTDFEYANQMTPSGFIAVVEEFAGLRQQIATHYAENKSFPTDMTEMGGAESVVYSDNGGMPVAVYDGGVIAVNYGGDGDGEPYLVLSPDVDEAGVISWYCAGQNIDQDLLPESCR